MPENPLPRRLMSARASVLAAALAVLLAGCTPSAPDPELALRWTWRRHLAGAKMIDLDLSFNGRQVVVVAAAGAGADQPPVHLVIGLEDGKMVNDWRLQGASSLALDGAGEALLVADAGGEMYLYADWRKSDPPRRIGRAAGAAALGPDRTSVLMRPAGSARWVLKRSGGDTELAGAPAEGVARAWFPFLGMPDAVAFAVPGELRVFTGGAQRVAFPIQAPVHAAASGYAEGGVLAAVAGNPPRFQAFSLDAGKLGDWPMGGGIDRAHLACSLTGALCAAIAEAGKGRVLRLFDTRAGERWRTALAHEGGGMPRVVVAAGGKVIIASERVAAGWRIRAWDGAGKALWQAPIAGPLVDFRASWSGKRIAAVTEDGYIVYFDADVIAPKKPEAGKS